MKTNLPMIGGLMLLLAGCASDTRFAAPDPTSATASAASPPSTQSGSRSGGQSGASQGPTIVLRQIWIEATRWQSGPIQAMLSCRQVPNMNGELKNAEVDMIVASVNPGAGLLAAVQKPVPGNSRFAGSPEKLKAIWAALLWYAAAPDCDSVKVTGTEVAPSGDVEYWTVYRCGTTVNYTVRSVLGRMNVVDTRYVVPGEELMRQQLERVKAAYACLATACKADDKLITEDMAVKTIRAWPSLDGDQWEELLIEMEKLQANTPSNPENFRRYWETKGSKLAETK